MRSQVKIMRYRKSTQENFWTGRKEGDRILDEKYVGDDKIVVREFIVEVAPYSDKDIAEYKKVMEREHK